jgi:hypothetical protein
MKPAPPVTRILSLLRALSPPDVASEHIVADPPRAHARARVDPIYAQRVFNPAEVTNKGDSGPTSRTVRRFLPMTAHEEPLGSTCDSAASDDGGRGVAEGVGGCDPGFHPPELTKTEEENPQDGVPGFPRWVRSARKFRRSGSISRILFRRSSRSDGGDHSSSPEVTRGVQRPTRGLRPGQPQTPPYLVLLRVGFTLPALSPGRRCALTAPFHPCHHRLPGSSAVCFLWHFP